MTKKEEMEDPESVWNKTVDDEPVFVLVARDVTAPEAVLDWLTRAALRGVGRGKVQDARKLREKMLLWRGNRKLPD